MLTYTEYKALGLSVGESSKVVHEDCPQGTRTAAMQVTREQSSFFWYCHRCKQHGRVSGSTLSPNEFVQEYNDRKTLPKAYQKSVVLPKDFTSTIPPEHMLWFYKYGLTDQDILTHRFGFSPYLQRIVLPIYSSLTDELLYWQGRYVHTPDSTHPKYINVRKAGCKDIYFPKALGTSTVIVLVEDILSCIRVGNTGLVHAEAILGSYIDPLHISQLASTYDEIILWLDFDKRKEVLQAVNRFRCIGYNVTAVVTHNDPKCYTDREIGNYCPYETM